MNNYIDILRNEFVEMDDSFLIKIRVHLEWDKKHFAQLVSAMKACCENQEGAENIEKWLAGGFWYVSRFVRDWTTHENFPRPYPNEYYEEAYEYLDDLADWLFMGECPYLGGTMKDWDA